MSSEYILQRDLKASLPIAIKGNGIYIYDEAEVLDFSGPFEVFSTASRFCTQKDKFNVFLIAETLGPVKARGGYSINPTYCFDSHPSMDILIVVGGVHTGELKKEQVIVFKHNDYKDLESKLLQNNRKGRVLIAIEGVYSMGGDLAPKEIFELGLKHNALLIVDEAHSSGVIGDSLLGIFDYYNIKPKENHVKMGTLG